MIMVNATFSKHESIKIMIYFPLPVNPVSQERKLMVKYIRGPAACAKRLNINAIYTVDLHVRRMPTKAQRPTSWNQCTQHIHPLPPHKHLTCTKACMTMSLSRRKSLDAYLVMVFQI